MTWAKGHWQLFLLIVLVLALWNTPLLLPLRILVVLFHEISHGLAAILTGGSIESLTVSTDEGGLAVTRGGSRFWILSAGYLGSLVCGVVLFLAALWGRTDRVTLGLLGLLLLLITALYLRGLFAIVFGLATGIACLAIARFLSHPVNDLVLRIIGLTSMVYVPRDIISDTIARAHLRSDAYMLGLEFAGGAIFWGVLWLILSFFVIAWCLWVGLRQPSNIRFGSGASRG